MAHRSEESRSLETCRHILNNTEEIIDHARGFNDLFIIVLPSAPAVKDHVVFSDVQRIFTQIAEELVPNATLITLGHPVDLVHVHTFLSSMKYQLWISLRRQNPKYDSSERSLPENHFGALVYKKYSGALNPKKTLQLDVRRVAKILERLPKREDMMEHGKYPIRFYDEYFASWGEVCAAARHDGMSEVMVSIEPEEKMADKKQDQLGLF